MDIDKMNSTELKAFLWDINSEINRLNRDAQVVMNKLAEVEMRAKVNLNKPDTKSEEIKEEIKKEIDTEIVLK